MTKQEGMIIWSTLFSFVMIFFSVLIIGTGRIAYGPDAFIIAIMGWMFMTSLRCVIRNFQDAYKLFKSKKGKNK